MPTPRSRRSPGRRRNPAASRRREAVGADVVVADGEVVVEAGGEDDLLDVGHGRGAEVDPGRIVALELERVEAVAAVHLVVAGELLVEQDHVVAAAAGHDRRRPGYSGRGPEVEAVAQRAASEGVVADPAGEVERGVGLGRGVDGHIVGAEDVDGGDVDGESMPAAMKSSLSVRTVSNSALTLILSSRSPSPRSPSGRRRSHGSSAYPGRRRPPASWSASRWPAT